MSTTLANINSLIDDRRRDSGSGSIDMTAEGFRAINSALNIWNQMHDWEFQIEETLLNYHQGVSYYAVPTAFKSPLDMRYYRGSRTEEFALVSEASFDSRTLESRRFAIATTGQTELLRIRAAGNSVQLHTLEDSDDGTWTAAGAVSGLTDDSNEFFELASSVKFSYSGTSGTITITGFSPVDISDFVDRSGIYWNMRSNSWTNWTSITLKFGSDASNYYTASVTTDYLSSTPTANQWSKFKILWSSLTTVGSPDNENIDYIQFTIAFSSNPSTTMWVENLFISEDIPILFEYYSTNMVKAASGGAKTQVFSNSSNTTDTPLWTGKWDFITESFINSVLEIIFWITGEYEDMNVAVAKIQEIVNNLKQRFPTRKRYPEIKMTLE